MNRCHKILNSIKKPLILIFVLLQFASNLAVLAQSSQVPQGPGFIGDGQMTPSGAAAQTQPTDSVVPYYTPQTTLIQQAAEQNAYSTMSQNVNSLLVGNTYLDNYNETYMGLHTFFGNDVVGNLFNNIGQLIGKWLSEFIDGWVAQAAQFLTAFLRTFVLNPNIAVNGLASTPGGATTNDGISAYIREGANVMYGIAIDLLLLLFILCIWRNWVDAAWRGNNNLMGAVGRLIFTAGLLLAWPTLYAFEIQITNEMIKAIYFDSTSQVMMLDSAIASAIKGGLVAGGSLLVNAFAPVLGSTLGGVVGGSVGGVIGGDIGAVVSYAALVIYLLLGVALISELIYILILKAVQTALLTAQYMFAPIFLVFMATPDTEQVASGFIRSFVEVSLWTFVWVGLLKVLVIIIFSGYNPWGQIVLCVGVLQIMIQVPSFLARAQISPMSDYISAGMVTGGLLTMASSMGKKAMSRTGQFFDWYTNQRFNAAGQPQSQTVDLNNMPKDVFNRGLLDNVRSRSRGNTPENKNGESQMQQPLDANGKPILPPGPVNGPKKPGDGGDKLGGNLGGGGDKPGGGVPSGGKPLNSLDPSGGAAVDPSKAAKNTNPAEALSGLNSKKDGAGAAALAGAAAVAGISGITPPTKSGTQSQSIDPNKANLQTGAIDPNKANLQTGAIDPNKANLQTGAADPNKSGLKDGINPPPLKTSQDQKQALDKAGNANAKQDIESQTNTQLDSNGKSLNIDPNVKQTQGQTKTNSSDLNSQANQAKLNGQNPSGLAPDLAANAAANTLNAASLLGELAKPPVSNIRSASGSSVSGNAKQVQDANVINLTDENGRTIGVETLLNPSLSPTNGAGGAANFQNQGVNVARSTQNTQQAANIQGQSPSFAGPINLDNNTQPPSVARNIAPNANWVGSSRGIASNLSNAAIASGIVDATTQPTFASPMDSSPNLSEPILKNSVNDESVRPAKMFDQPNYMHVLPRGLATDIRTAQGPTQETSPTGRASIVGNGQGQVNHVRYAPNATREQEAMQMYIAGYAGALSSDSEAYDAARQSAISAGEDRPQGVLENAAAGFMAYNGSNFRQTALAKQRFNRSLFKHAVLGSEAYVSGESGNAYTEYLRVRYGAMTPDKQAWSVHIMTDPESPESGWSADNAPATDTLLNNGLPITESNRAVAANKNVRKLPAWARGTAIRGAANYLETVVSSVVPPTAHPMEKAAALGHYGPRLTQPEVSAVTAIYGESATPDEDTKNVDLVQQVARLGSSPIYNGDYSKAYKNIRSLVSHMPSSNGSSGTVEVNMGSQQVASGAANVGSANIPPAPNFSYGSGEQTVVFNYGSDNSTPVANNNLGNFSSNVGQSFVHTGQMNFQTKNAVNSTHSFNRVAEVNVQANSRANTPNISANEIDGQVQRASQDLSSKIHSSTQVLINLSNAGFSPNDLLHPQIAQTAYQVHQSAPQMLHSASLAAKVMGPGNFDIQSVQAVHAMINAGHQPDRISKQDILKALGR